MKQNTPNKTPKPPKPNRFKLGSIISIETPMIIAIKAIIDIVIAIFAVFWKTQRIDNRAKIANEILISSTKAKISPR